MQEEKSEFEISSRPGPERAGRLVVYLCLDELVARRRQCAGSYDARARLPRFGLKELTAAAGAASFRPVEAPS